MIGPSPLFTEFYIFDDLLRVFIISKDLQNHQKGIDYMHCSEAIYLDHYGKQALPVCLKKFHEFSFWLVLRSPLAMHVVQIEERG